MTASHGCHFAMLPLGPAQIRTQIEEIVLDADQDIADRRIHNVKHRDADHGVRFVDGAVGRHARMEFRQPRAVAKRRAPVVTRTGVDSIEFHGSHPTRPSGLPGSAATLYQSSRSPWKSRHTIPGSNDDPIDALNPSRA